MDCETENTDEVTAIVGCAFYVYNKLGYGFLEDVYQRALEIQLKRNNIPFESKKKISVYFDGELLNSYYEADIICSNSIIIELKAVSHLTEAHEAQLIHYLKATGCETGLLLNFGYHDKLEWKKIVYTNKKYLMKNNIPGLP